MYRSAAVLAGRFFDRGGRRARISHVNLRIAFPEKTAEERYRLARRSFVELAWSAIDIARVRRWGAEDLREHVEFCGREYIEKAHSAGRGCLVLIPHLGSLEVALRAAPAHGVPIAVLTKPASNPLINEHLNDQRERAGAAVLAHRGEMQTAMRALRDRRLVVVANDQYERRRRSVRVPFFGVQAPTGRGLAALSLRTGAPVVPVYITRRDATHSRMVCLPPLEPVRTGAFARDLETLTKRYNEVIEGIVREHPEQYLWAHKRFRNCPDLPHDVYDR